MSSRARDVGRTILSEGVDFAAARGCIGCQCVESHCDGCVISYTAVRNVYAVPAGRVMGVLDRPTPVATFAKGTCVMSDPAM